MPDHEDEGPVMGPGAGLSPGDVTGLTKVGQQAVDVVKTEKSGCAKVPAVLAGFILLLLVAAVLFIVKLTSDDKSDNAAATKSCNEHSLVRTGDVQLIAYAACDNPGTVQNSATEASTGSGSSSSDGTAGGGTASIAPPDAASLPKGAILLQGSSGSNHIGFIAQDGLSRYGPITGTGISTDANSVAIIWDKGAGKVVSFGSNLHTGTNNGRYGFALFRNTPATPPTTSPSGEADSPYRAGCAIEVGQTSCKSETAGAPVVNGDKVTIIIGEQGHTNAGGDYSADWWFVFQPD